MVGRRRSMGFDRAETKAVACEVVRETGEPLSRQSTAVVTRRVRERIDKSISATTVWRWLDEAAIKPWQYEYSKYPRSQDFGDKAAPILDLYQGLWQGQPLGENEFVISTDEELLSRVVFLGQAASCRSPSWKVFPWRRGRIRAWPLRRRQPFCAD